MKGMIFSHAAVAVLLFIAVISDTRTCKIPNRVTVPFILAGLLFNTLLLGWEGFLQAAAGMLLPVMLLAILHRLHMLGAGDIKLFSAVGSMMGAGFVLASMVYAFLAGGLMALMLMAIRKNGRQRLKYLRLYIQSCYLCHSLLPYIDTGIEGGRFPFAWAIACGTVMQITAGFILLVHV